MSLPAPRRAILLIGPTGSGKTPFGDHLQAAGLDGRRCAHFDFGAELREAASRAATPGLSPADISFIKRVLGDGALLERETFHIAEALLADFLRRRDIGSADLLVLNDLPRHVEQAADVDRILRIVLVLVLECDAATVRARIAVNSGGDRTGRADDRPEDVRRKLELFARRTSPVVEHYRAAGVPVVTLDVKASTTPQEMAAQLARQGAGIPPCL